MFTLQPDLASIILLSLLALFVAIQVAYHLNIYGRFIKKTEHNESDYNWQGVSIVIAARSEYDNLQKLVPVLLEQDYPNYEILIVDDASWDGTTGYLEELEKMHPKIRGVFVTEEMKRNYQGKKLALSLGIKAAQNDIILLTDADCLPNSNQWIKHMVRPFHHSAGTEIVLGYSPFSKQGGMVNIISRMDNLYTGMTYFSYAMKKDPYMGVVLNLAKKISLFFKQKWIATNIQIEP
ncbi:MAG: glycosyltransferase, partial [Bacteroidetes bacterium]|nr:glycosyltransferase [Bacteroidota bacterium]